MGQSGSLVWPESSSVHRTFRLPTTDQRRGSCAPYLSGRGDEKHARKHAAPGVPCLNQVPEFEAAANHCPPPGPDRRVHAVAKWNRPKFPRMSRSESHQLEQPADRIRIESNFVSEIVVAMGRPPGTFGVGGLQDQP